MDMVKGQTIREIVKSWMMDYADDLVTGKNPSPDNSALTATREIVVLVKGRMEPNISEGYDVHRVMCAIDRISGLEEKLHDEPPLRCPTCKQLLAPTP